MYAADYSVLIHQYPYMPVYYSVYITYMGTLYPLIFVISWSASNR